MVSASFVVMHNSRKKKKSLMHRFDFVFGSDQNDSFALIPDSQIWI